MPLSILDEKFEHAGIANAPFTMFLYRASSVVP